MRLLFLHHQQRRPYQEEPGYNELHRPFIRARQVTGWSEFVYQTPLRQFLVDELRRRGRTPTGDPSRFIATNFDADLYDQANIALLPALLKAVEDAAPDLIVYSMTWMTETIHPGSFAVIKARFPQARIFAAVWDHGEGGPFFHSYERQLIDTVDFYASTDSQRRVTRMRAREAPYYQDYGHVERVHWFPTVHDPELYRPSANAEARTSDVAILGSSEGYRRDVVAALAERFGTRFHHLGGHMAEDKYVSIEAYVDAINRTKIIVNTQTYLHRQQIKGRVREVLSCGGFLLEQDNPESREFLEGSGVIFFSDMPDLIAKIDYYLAHDAERERIARATHDWYRARYTPDLTLQHIITACFDRPVG